MNTWSKRAYNSLNDLNRHKTFMGRLWLIIIMVAKYKLLGEA